MKLGQALGRALVGSMLIYGGQNAFRHAQMLVPKVDEKLHQWVPDVVDKVGSTNLVKINGATMVGAGTTMSLGILPRTSAAILLGTLIPTTAAGHRFWDQKDPALKSKAELGFFNNLATAGGLMLVLLAPRKKKAKKAKKDKKA